MQLRNLKLSVKKERKCKTISQSQNKAMDAKTLSWHPQGTEKNKWQVRTGEAVTIAGMVGGKDL